MAGKQLGKLRQWAGEVISSRERTGVTDEFRELEQDIEVRKEGLHRLLVISEEYHHSLSKRKESEALNENDKLLPLDALGIVMINHGEELGDESPFGSALVKFGRAHCKIATLQEAFALTFQDTFLSAMHRYEDEIKDYLAQRKKLDSRRLSYDAAISKCEKLKASKKEKEKEKLEAEEEMEQAKSRYEETSEDVRAIMVAMQDNERQQIRELTVFLDLELNFVSQYQEVLKDVKANWIEVPSISRSGSNRSTAPSRRSSGVADLQRNGTGRSKAKVTPSNEDESEEDDAETPAPHRSSFLHRRKTSSASKASSRAPSLASSHHRRDSTATNASATEKDKEKNEKAGDKGSKRLNMTGWMSSMTSRKSKDKDNFSTLRDRANGASDDGDEDEDRDDRSNSSKMSTSKSKHRSKGSTSSAASKVSMRLKKSVSSSPERKVVKALYDFSGAPDELSFKAGDKINVVNEVLDEWWMGELDGKQGLFPTNYTEVVAPQTSRAPSRASSNYRPPGKKRSKLGLRSTPTPSTSSEEEGRQGLVNSESEESFTEESPDEDHHRTMQHRNPVYGDFDKDRASSDGEDERTTKKMTAAPDNESELSSSLKQTIILPTRRTTTDPLPNTAFSAAGGKAKPPPPPAPRRATHNTSQSMSTLPALSVPTQVGALRTRSANSISVLSTAHQNHSAESPFDSPKNAMFSLPAGGHDECRQFQQNPFKPSGMCNNCFQMHG